MADQPGGTGATPPANDPAAGATPGGQQQTDPGATPGAGSTEGATPDPQQTGDAGLQSALDRERQLRRDAEQRDRDARRRINELEDAGKSENERLAAQLQRTTADFESTRTENEQLKAEIARRDLDALKLEVATEFKLPAGMAARLRGDDKRSLRADADALAKELDTGTPVGSFGGGRGGAASGTRQADMNTLIRQAAGRG